jgi:hypothetical protein
LRKLLSFVVASAIFGCGVWLAIAQFLWSDIIFGKLLIGAGFLMALGGYWLWADHIGPALGIKVEE